MRLLSITILLMVSATAVFAKEYAEYPVAERKLFMEGCVSGNMAMREFCVCALTKFQDTMTFKEYAAMNDMTDEELRRYKPYASAILTCVEEVK